MARAAIGARVVPPAASPAAPPFVSSDPSPANLFCNPSRAGPILSLAISSMYAMPARMPPAFEPPDPPPVASAIIYPLIVRILPVAFRVVAIRRPASVRTNLPVPSTRTSPPAISGAIGHGPALLKVEQVTEDPVGGGSRAHEGTAGAGVMVTTRGVDLVSTGRKAASCSTVRVAVRQTGHRRDRMTAPVTASRRVDTTSAFTARPLVAQVGQWSAAIVLPPGESVPAGPRPRLHPNSDPGAGEGNRGRGCKPG